MSTIDVVVPCYNYGRYLEGCLASVFAQTGVDVRALVIDDASTDDTPDIGRRLTASDSRITFHRHKENRGHVRTYNEGLLEWAAAEYSLLLSADDMLAPGALARATQVMNRCPDVSMAYGMAQYFSGSVTPVVTEAPAFVDTRVISGDEFLRRCFEHGNAVSTPTAVVRTSVQQELGGYSVELPHSGDMEMWMRFAAHGPIGVVSAVQAFYRWHGDNMSYKYRTAQLSDMIEVEQACDSIIARCGDKFPEILTWKSAMHRRFGADCFWISSTAFDLGDIETFRIALEAAERYDPALRRTGDWWKLHGKALLGHTVWALARPTLDTIRAYATGRRLAGPRHGMGSSSAGGRIRRREGLAHPFRDFRYWRAIAGWNSRALPMLSRAGPQIALATAASAAVGVVWHLSREPFGSVVAFGTIALPLFNAPFELCLAFIVLSHFRIPEVFTALFPLHLPEIVAITCLAALCWHLLVTRRIRPFWCSELTLLTMFFGVTTIGVATAIDRPMALAFWSGYFVKVVAITFAVAWLARSPRQFATVIYAFTAAGLAVGGVALWNKVHGIGLVEGTRVTIGRDIGSILGDPNDLAITLLFPTAFALSLAFTRGISSAGRCFGAAGAIVLMLAILATQSSRRADGVARRVRSLRGAAREVEDAVGGRRAHGRRCPLCRGRRPGAGYGRLDRGDRRVGDGQVERLENRSQHGDAASVDWSRHRQLRRPILFLHRRLDGEGDRGAQRLVSGAGRNRLRRPRRLRIDARRHRLQAARRLPATAARRSGARPPRHRHRAGRGIGGLHRVGNLPQPSLRLAGIHPAGVERCRLALRRHRKLRRNPSQENSATFPGHDCGIATA